MKNLIQKLTGGWRGLIRRRIGTWSRKKKILVTVSLLVLVIAGIAGVRVYQSGKERAAMAKAGNQIQTVQVTKQNLIDSISVTGTIASADAWDVSASAKNVEVLQVNYGVGDYVNKGDVIAVLDSTDLEISLSEAQNKQALSEYTENKSIESATESYQEAVEDGAESDSRAAKSTEDAKEDLQDADADLADAEDEMDDAEDAKDAAKEALNAATKPAEVAKPDTTVSEPTQKLEGPADDTEKAAAAYEENQAAWAAYEENQAAWAAYNTYQEELAAYNALESAYEKASGEYSSAKQAYENAQDAYDKAADSYENAVESQSDTQKQNSRNVDNAADNLEKARMEHTYSNDSSQQTIDNYQDQIDSCTVTAPISGVITAMNIAVGDTYMGEGSTMFSIADNEHFIVTANVDEYEISDISKDMEAAVIVEALGDEELPAKVSFVSPTAAGSNTGSASYQIEIALDDVNTDLRIGMTAKASIVKKAVYDVLTVPYDCVETDEDGNSVVYIDQNGEKTALSVTTGMETDYYIEVSGEGLEEGMMVYYSTPMLGNSSDSSDSSEDTSESMHVQMDAPAGGGPGGGMPGGGGPGGF